MLFDADVHINGCKIPSALVVALRDGSWEALRATSHERIEEVLLSKPPSMDDLTLHNYQYMVMVTGWLLHDAGAKSYRGVSDDPGLCMEVDKTVVIGEVGRGEHWIALDYRADPPIVRTLHGPGWVTVADSIESFMELLAQ